MITEDDHQFGAESQTEDGPVFPRQRRQLFVKVSVNVRQVADEWQTVGSGRKGAIFPPDAIQAEDQVHGHQDG